MIGKGTNKIEYVSDRTGRRVNKIEGQLMEGAPDRMVAVAGRAENGTNKTGAEGTGKGVAGSGEYTVQTGLGGYRPAKGVDRPAQAVGVTVAEKTAPCPWALGKKAGVPSRCGAETAGGSHALEAGEAPGACRPGGPGVGAAEAARGA